MKRITHILIPGVLLLTAAFSAILPPVTHAQTGTVLAAPALTADDTKANRVELIWTAVPGAVRYALWAWWDGLEDWQPLDDGDLTATSYSHEDLTAGTTYYYIVVAVDANGAWGAWSNEANATAPPDGAVADLQEPAVTLAATPTPQPQEAQSQLVEEPGPVEGVELSATPTPTHTATAKPAMTATLMPTHTSTPTPAATATPTATATSPPALTAADAAEPVQAAQERSPSALAVTPTISPAPAEETSEDDSVGRGGSESGYDYRECSISRDVYKAITPAPTPGPATPGATATVAAQATAHAAAADEKLEANCRYPGRQEER